MKKNITIGVIGCGLIGQFHIENILSNFKEVKIRSVSDINTGMIKASRYGIEPKNVCSDYRDIISDSKINTVLICTPVNIHAKLILEAAVAGKDIFCEKQIGDNPVELKEALNAVKKAGVKLQVGFMRRFDKNFQKVKKMIEKGGIGSIHIVRVTSRDVGVPPMEYLKTAPGIFQDMTCHDFDILRYLTNSEIEEVYTAAKVLIEPYITQFNDYDTVIVTLKFKNGAIGTIDNSLRTTYGYDQRVEVFGSKGCLMVENVIPSQTLLLNEKGTMKDKLFSDKEKFFVERYFDAYVEQFKSFFCAIQSNKEVEVDGIDGLRNVLVAVAAKESAEKNIPIKVDYSICE